MFRENCSSTTECNCSAFPPLETAMDMNFIWHFQCWMMYSQNNIIKGCVSVLCLLLFMIAALWQTQPKTQINYSSLCMRYSPQWRIQKYPLWYWLKKEACACKPIFLLPGCVKEQKKLQSNRWHKVINWFSWWATIQKMANKEHFCSLHPSKDWWLSLFSTTLYHTPSHMSTHTHARRRACTHLFNN